MSKSVLKILTFVVFLFPQILSAGTDSLFFDFCGNGEFHELILTDKKYDGADVSLWEFANQASDEQLVSTSKKRFPVVSYQSKVHPQILFAGRDSRDGFGSFYSLNAQKNIDVFSFPRHSTPVRGVISSKKENFIGIVFRDDFEEFEGVELSKSIFNADSFTEIMTEFFGENKIQDGDKISVLWFKIDCEARRIFPVKNFEN